MWNKRVYNLKNILVTSPWHNYGSLKTMDLYGWAWGSDLGDFIVVAVVMFLSDFLWFSTTNKHYPTISPYSSIITPEVCDVPEQA
jgi:hypothetical protein